MRIIRIIGEEMKSSGKIHEGLKEADIIERNRYREVEDGAPEKVWRHKTKEINIDFLETTKKERGEFK